MDLLIAANTLLEFLVNRSQFISEVEYLSEMFESNSSARLYIAEPGLDKIASYLKLLNGLENSEKIVDAIKKRVKVLALTQVLAQEARFSCATNYESAVEVQLAIEANIGAIVTHKPSDFSSEEFTIITLNKLEERHKLEINYLKNNLPAILVISNLNKALYHLPSYTDVKSLETHESTRQLDLTCSSDKVSTPSTDKLSPQSTNTRSTAYADVAKLRNLGLESLTCKTSIDTLKVGIDRGLSIKSPELQSIGQLKSPRIGGITATAPQAYENSLGDKLTKDMLQMAKGLSLAVDSLSIKSPIPQPIRQLESTRFGGLTATVPQPYENSLGGKLKKDELQMAKGLSLAVDSLSIKSPISQPIRQLESKIFGSIAATVPQPYENSLDTLKERIDRSSKINPLLKVDHSFSDRSGVLSQIKLVESMQRANTLDSYLPRKN
jgi:hypothetical protein